MFRHTLTLILIIFLVSCTEETPQVSCEGNDLSLAILNIEPAICGVPTGVIEVMAAGGTEPYSFNLDGSSSNQNGRFTAVRQGTYRVNVIDANNCSVAKEVTVEPTGEVSFLQVIAPILESNCTLPTCHVPEPGTARQDLTDFTIVQQLAPEIKRRTQNGEMPKEGSITQAEIDLIACWVDNGAPNN